MEMKLSRKKGFIRPLLLMFSEMSKPKRPDRKAKVSEISTGENIERFKILLKTKFNSKTVPDRGQYVVLHERIPIHDKNSMDVIVYTTDRIYISTSPQVTIDVFSEKATEVVRLAQESTRRLAEVRPITLQRARSIIEFASNLDPDNDFERMIIVILADCSNEIVLTEEMKAERIRGDALNYGIPDKIKCLEEKGKVVYKSDEIKNVRDLRNEIVHRGNIPDRVQATEAFSVAKSVLEWRFKE